MNAPPDHVRAAFGVSTIDGAVMTATDGRLWRFGDVVLRRTDHPVAAAWEAGVCESLHAVDLQIARPVRSLDGRWVVGGWSAGRHVEGAPLPRFAETVTASFALEDALLAVAKPRRWPGHDDVSVRADALTWNDYPGTGWESVPAAGGTDHTALGLSRGAQLWRSLAADRRPVALADQLVHADLFGHVLFTATAAPTVLGLAPLWRPPGLSGAIAAVDALAWGGAPIEVLDSGRGRTCWGQLVRRAVLYRLAYVLLHPRRTRDAVWGMVEAATQARAWLASSL